MDEEKRSQRSPSSQIGGRNTEAEVTPRPLIPWRGDPSFDHNLNNLAPFIVPVQEEAVPWDWTINVLVTGFGVRNPPPPRIFAPNPHKPYQFAESAYFSCLHSLSETTAKTRPTSSPAVSLPNTTSPASPRFISTHTQTQSQYPTAQCVTSSPSSFSLTLPPPSTTMATRTTKKIRNQILYIFLLLQNQITISSYTLA